MINRTHFEWNLPDERHTIAIEFILTEKTRTENKARKLIISNFRTDDTCIFCILQVSVYLANSKNPTSVNWYCVPMSFSVSVDLLFETCLLVPYLIKYNVSTAGQSVIGYLRVSRKLGLQNWNVP